MRAATTLRFAPVSAVLYLIHSTPRLAGRGYAGSSIWVSPWPPALGGIMQQQRSQIWITGLLLFTLLVGLGAGILVDREVLGARSQAAPGTSGTSPSTN